jgi:hypothetical protein
MARSYIRPQSPRGITLGIAFVLWLVGAGEMLTDLDLPFVVGQWALLIGLALLILGCTIRGL